MPNWTHEQAVSTKAGRASEGAKPQRAVRHEPVATTPREAANTGRVRVCVTGRRLRLIDPDNLCPKYFIDCLRYAGLIEDDSADKITLEVRQEKVRSADEECTEITIERIEG